MPFVTFQKFADGTFRGDVHLNPQYVASIEDAPAGGPGGRMADASLITTATGARHIVKGDAEEVVAKLTRPNRRARVA